MASPYDEAKARADAKGLPLAIHGVNEDGELVCLYDPCPECNPWGSDPDAWKGGHHDGEA